MALGAFLAGMVVGRSDFSLRAAAEALPMQDAFAVLFFVSVGMLFNPGVILAHPLALLATLAIIIIGKSLAAYAIVRAFGRDNRTAITISASLAQIGEFSFILANLGTDLAILPTDGRDLILAGAILSILLHPVLFSLAAKRARRTSQAEPADAKAEERYMIVVGYGRVGKYIGQQLREENRPFVLIDDQADVVAMAVEAGVETVRGNAASGEILKEAGIDRASHLLVAIPEGFEAGGIAEVARTLNPDINIIARAHSKEEVQHLQDHGANRVIMGEEEIARRMVAAT
jgi:CPA2 family monovalent cation:H+ antiporter-2